MVTTRNQARKETASTEEGKKMSMVVDWSKINTELLDLIMKRLDLIEFTRAGAVCQSWWSTMKTCRYISPPKSHTPWLILSSRHQPDFRYATDLAADPKSLYKFNLPDMKYHCIVGSSHGFIISVDEICQLHATNPITGSHRLLPAITTFPCCEDAVRDPITNQISAYFIRNKSRDRTDLWTVPDVQKYFCGKVALFPTSSSAGLISVFFHNTRHEIAFACQSDESWTCIQSPSIADALFYKGLLYAVDYQGALFAFDILNYSASSRPVIHQEIRVEGCNNCFSKKYLVKSSCGSDLFLIAMYIDCCMSIRNDDGAAHKETMETEAFKIYKLNQDCYEWSKVSSFGTNPVVVFLGFNPSVMLLAKDIPNTAVNKGDCIYFTDGDRFHKRHNTPVIFYLEDNKIVPLDIAKDHPQQFIYPKPFWLTPINK